MDKKETFAAAGRLLFGDTWQAGITRLLGYSDSSHIRCMMRTEGRTRNIPARVWPVIEKALQARKIEIDELLPEVRARGGILRIEQ